ncbi:MAG: hypothetical protein HOW73_49310 [Polyangiaceae bacterium]|nr:hypothetical protein [Polyangiaceae bacterium]
MKNWKSFTAAALATLAVAAGCGMGAGDYETYRVAFSDSTLSESCGADSEDSTTFRTGNTFLLYFVGTESGDIPYLDVGGSVLEGTETDDGYAFSGTSKDVEDNGDSVTTTTTTIDITLIPDGDSISGTQKVRVSLSCDGDCQGFDGFDCTGTSDFLGVVVDETIEVGTDDGNANP